jgi:FK506-binding protein 4/5
MDEDIDMPPSGGEDMIEKYFAEEGPVMKVGDEKEVGKQGLKKKLLKRGNGWDSPEVGDEVEGTRAPASSD